jgi:hypothetical protein
LEEKLNIVAQEIRRIAFDWEEKLKGLTEEERVTRLNRQGRNIKLIIGHLIDSASNNHQRMIRLQYTSNLDFPGYSTENDMWISIQQYHSEDWNEMLQLWKYYILHIAHIIAHTDHSWLSNEWMDGKNDPITLNDVIFGYLAHLRLHMSEINALLEQNGNGKNHTSLEN